MRDYRNYGGAILAMEIDGEPVESFYAPIRFTLNTREEELFFDLRFDRWEDISDFDSGKPPLQHYQRRINSSGVQPGELDPFQPAIAAVKTGVVDFLELDPGNFEFQSLNIDALAYSIFAEARHKTRNGYIVNAPVDGEEDFAAVKAEYLDSIVMPLLQMAWGLAQSDRRLSKFTPVQ